MMDANLGGGTEKDEGTEYRTHRQREGERDRDI